MQLNTIYCNICHKSFPYPQGLQMHHHPELEIGGVPMNIWDTRYSLPKNPAKLIKEGDALGIYKYSAYLPKIGKTKDRFSLEEGDTPLLKIKAEVVSCKGKVFLKDESTNPTGSFKDRGMPLLLADIINQGKRKVAIPSTGNAAVSLTKYAKKYGIEVIVFVPEDTSVEKINLLSETSTIVFDCDLIESYEHFIRFCKSNPDVYTGLLAINIPYTQGLKTIAYEIYEQLGRRSPDWLIIPCGSGGNLVGQYRGFKDLLEMGLIKTMPKFISVQIENADPITQGFQKKQTDTAVIIDSPVESKASAIASDTCFNYKKIQNILSKTNGLALSVNDDEITECLNLANLEFASMSAFAALRKMSHIRSQDTVVMIGTSKKRL